MHRNEPDPDLEIIKVKVAQLTPGRSVVYYRGRTGFMRGHPAEKDWLAWVEKMNEMGWIDFTQRRIDYCVPVIDFLTKAPMIEVGVFEYIARHRHQRNKPMRW